MNRPAPGWPDGSAGAIDWANCGLTLWGGSGFPHSRCPRSRLRSVGKPPLAFTSCRPTRAGPSRVRGRCGPGGTMSGDDYIRWARLEAERQARTQSLLRERERRRPPAIDRQSGKGAQ